MSQGGTVDVRNGGDMEELKGPAPPSAPLQWRELLPSLLKLFEFCAAFSFFCNGKVPLEPKNQAANSRPRLPTPQTRAGGHEPFRPTPQKGQLGRISSFFPLQ